MEPDLEAFWTEVLSDDAGRVRLAVGRLSRTERQPVELHLKRMASETGWSEGQRRRARTALEAMGWEPD